jgi:glycosyltransferase involved in cell wall biosynthesis
MKQICGVECAAIISPCIWAKFPHVEWQDKEQAFMMIGRIVPEKQVARAIAILDAVRHRGHAIRLHLCGHIGNDRYGRQIAALCRKHADWIIPEGRVQGDRKTQILSRCRFGIQARNAEPFGISVAEMIKAGAIVFASDDGGQAEILDHKDLLFKSVIDATTKISGVLSNHEQQESLRNHLKQRSSLYRAENFIQESLKVITSSQRACISA